SSINACRSYRRSSAIRAASRAGNPLESSWRRRHAASSPRARTPTSISAIGPGHRGGGGGDSAVEELLAPVLGLAPQPPLQIAAILPDARERRRVRVNRDRWLAGTVRHRMDVAAGASAGHSRHHPNRLGLGADRQAPLVELALHADETDARAV